MVVYHQVCVDLEFPCDVPPVRMIQGDTARTLGIMLLSGGAPWPVPEGAEVFIRYRNEQSGGLYDTLPNGNSGWSADGNILTIGLPPQLFAVPGNCTVQVVFVKEQLQLSTIEIVISVEGELKDSEEPEPYYNLAQWLSRNNNAYTVAVSNGFVGTVDEWLESLKGPKGDPGGPQGPKGDTPVKGVDYFTEADKQEMVQKVLAAMPEYDGTVVVV